MFGHSKPLASLSSGLLARKGTARPAMRPQGFGTMVSNNLDDLGWNDMGQEPAPVAAVTPEAAVEAPVPPVLVQREALKEEIETAPQAADAVPEVDADAPVEAPGAPVIALRPVSLATATRIGRESGKQTKKGKAAFTLRLDADRHLRLRLASALGGRSSQQLVTRALDAFLDTMPEVEALASQLPQKKVR